MRKISMIAFAALVAFSAPSFAEHDEDGPDKGQMHEPELLSDKMVERLDKRLQLSEKQKQGIKAALTESRPALKKKWEEMRAVQKEMRQLMRDSKEKIRSLLDAEQREKYDDMMSEMRRRRPMGEGGMMMRPGGPRKRFEGEGGRWGMRE